jgi:hypothetical protein
LLEEEGDALICASVAELAYPLRVIHIARRCVKTAWSSSPLYDVVLASRHPTAVKLFERANPNPNAATQSSIFDMMA